MFCLKNRTFAVSQTSAKPNKSLSVRLWFAWKIVLLQYHKHHYQRIGCRDSGCDLLEKSYFCSITNIVFVHHLMEKIVVICLKNRTFAVSQTSRSSSDKLWRLLWFAWKIVLLQYHKHQDAAEIIHNTSCDLLEKSYFCSITNILPCGASRGTTVVICLKNRTFAVSQTSGIERPW